MLYVSLGSDNVTSDSGSKIQLEYKTLNEAELLIVCLI